MLVYRVETPKGKGAFSCGATSWYDSERADQCGHRSYDMPAPADEASMGYEIEWNKHTSNHVFGCVSIDQLLEWFPCAQGRAAMARMEGVVIAVYEVDPDLVIIGLKQCSFKRQTHCGLRRTLWPVRMYDIATLEEI
jgi:hypothetical protein